MLRKLGIVASMVTALNGSLAFAGAAAGPDLAGARGTFTNVESAINNAVVHAERLYEENHGDNMKGNYDVIKNNQNPYLSVLRVTPDYKVELKFAGSAKNDSTNNAVPVAKGLLGASIVLMPVYARGDEKITAWECLTNADQTIQVFMGDSSTKTYTASRIRDYTTNQYLSLCIYIDKADLVK